MILESRSMARRSFCFCQKPSLAEVRRDAYPTAANRAKASTGSASARLISSARRMRSTSTTVGRVFPVSVRLIFAWLMAHRRASLSPESPAAVRNSRSTEARDLRLSCS